MFRSCDIAFRKILVFEKMYVTVFSGKLQTWYMYTCTISYCFMGLRIGLIALTLPFICPFVCLFKVNCVTVFGLGLACQGQRP